MDITTDLEIYYQWNWLKINATLVNTWIVMALLVFAGWLSTRKISLDRKKIPRFQHAMEIVITFMREQIREITEERAIPYLPFLGTLFLFISISNLLGVVPTFQPPTGSLSTTGALAVCSFLAVPYFGIRKLGLKNYLLQYFKPIFLIFPFKILGEITRTFALAVRLFGNMMSSTLIVLILVSVAPLFLPILFNLLGILIGQIQAYIFAALAAIYIASGMRITLAEKTER